MAYPGTLDPEPPDDGSEGDYAALLNPALLDSVDLSQQPDEALEAILCQIAPGARRDTPEARAARIEMDRRIVARVAAEGFDGPDTKKLLFAAFEYAEPVVGALIGTGQIFRECKRLCRPVNRQPGDVQWTDDDCAFLTERCVDAGIFHVFYEHGLKRGRWDPRRGTALTTYGVNACTLCFSSVYQKWWRARVLERSFGDLEVDLPAHVQVDLHQPDPAERVVNRLEAERLLGQMPEPARTALWLRGMHGETQAEAASFVGLTEKALESHIGRTRGKLGLTRDRPEKPGQDPAAAPEPEPELDAQEGDRDR
jgi:RNA polymerase sigma-70 factor (ECF subfamily)